jgi:hypothetical protein
MSINKEFIKLKTSALKIMSEEEYDYMLKSSEQKVLNKNYTNKLLVKKFSENAILPDRKSKDAAGYDICSTEETILRPYSHALVSTGIGFTVPNYLNLHELVN